jgi:catechol 1,2-dioxygenase
MAEAKPSRFDPNFTQHVIETTGPKTSARNREVLGALIRHLHDLAREIELTVDEWMLGVHFVNSVGQISNSIRNEGQRISDVLGLESCVSPVSSPRLPLLTS